MRVVLTERSEGLFWEATDAVFTWAAEPRRVPLRDPHVQLGSATIYVEGDVMFADIGASECPLLQLRAGLLIPVPIRDGVSPRVSRLRFAPVAPMDLMYSQAAGYDAILRRMLWSFGHTLRGVEGGGDRIPNSIGIWLGRVRP